MTKTNNTHAMNSTTGTPNPKRMPACLRHLDIWLKGSLIACFLTFAVLLWWYFGIPKAFPEVTEEQMPVGKHRIDLLLIDRPELSKEEIELMLRPLIIVADAKMPMRTQHFRIMVRPSGFPQGYAGSGYAAAGYHAENDVFLVDVAAVRSMVANATVPQRWAFVMAHEATHQWQNRTGALRPRTSRTHDHVGSHSDPIETEAYQAGVAVANVLPGNKFGWKFGDGTTYLAPDPNPYQPFADIPVAQRAEIFTQTQTTPGGTLSLAWETASGFWQR